MASFFVKLLDEGNDVPIPEWASDHPDSQRRVESIRRVAERTGWRGQFPGSGNKLAGILRGKVTSQSRRKSF